MEIARCMSRCHSRYQRACMPRSSSKPQCSSSKSHLYNREFELQKLGSLIETQPNSINVILGPRSCGKTAILRSHLKPKLKVIYLDCRETSLSTPAVFVTAVLKLLLLKSPKEVQDVVQKILERMLKALGFVMSGVKISWTDLEGPALLGKEDMSLSVIDAVNSCLRPVPAQNLNAVYEAISDVLCAWNGPSSSPDGKEWPVLVIDEVNRLQKWRDEHSRELGYLLSFLVFISKQAGRCHVLLATSEYGFQAWLNNAIGPEFWQPKVIGDFTEDHARKFLETMLQNDNAKRAKLDDSAWGKVYEVCGGNAGNLKRISSMIGQEDLETALESLWGVEFERVRNLSLGVGGAWTPAQYSEVALQLLNSRYHALPVADVELRLGRHVLWWKFWDVATQQQAGGQVLQQLVNANALSVRPLSVWAQDVPREAFGKGTAVVTAPSSMNLYCMSKVFEFNLKA